MTTSTAYIILQDRGWKYTFDGVTSIAHSLSLKVQTDADTSQDTEYINSARNEPDVVTLSVIASDVNATVENWSAQLFRSLAAIKENRLLCQVVTPLRSYENMLLTDLSVLQDETCTNGWIGTLTFIKTKVEEGMQNETDSNSSVLANSGFSTGNTSDGKESTFLTILKEAGIVI